MYGMGADGVNTRCSSFWLSILTTIDFLGFNGPSVDVCTSVRRSAAGLRSLLSIVWGVNVDVKVCFVNESTDGLIEETTGLTAMRFP